MSAPFKAGDAVWFTDLDGKVFRGSVVSVERATQLKDWEILVKLDKDAAPGHVVWGEEGRLHHVSAVDRLGQVTQ